jgi:hypothetical protein
MIGPVTEQELVALLSGLPGVVALTAAEENGAPEVAWGDHFFSYDPDDRLPPERRFPFATVVVNDYPGFDELSQLHRPGVFRVNLAIGTRKAAEVLGYPPADAPPGLDLAGFDRILPHPAYAAQGFVSVVMPGPRTSALVVELVRVAWGREKARYDRSG